MFCGAQVLALAGGLTIAHAGTSALVQWGGAFQEAVLTQPRNLLLPDLSPLGMSAPQPLANSDPMAALSPEKAGILLERARAADSSGELSRQALSETNAQRRAALRDEIREIDAREDYAGQRRRRIEQDRESTEAYIKRLEAEEPDKDFSYLRGPNPLLDELIAENNPQYGHWRSLRKRLRGLSTFDRPSAVSILNNANNILRDISPERLRDMPLEDLNALAAILLGAQKPSLQLSPEVQLQGASILAQARAQSNLSDKSFWPKSAYVGRAGVFGNGPWRFYVDQSPRSLKLLHAADPAAAPSEMHPTVFRHYTESKRDAGRIVSDAELNAGRTPYIRAGRLFVRAYRALTGIFLTSPELGPEAAGVSSMFGEMRYIDLLVPRLLPVLQAQPGIFFIPLPPGMEWVSLHGLSRDAVLKAMEKGRNPDGFFNKDALTAARSVGAEVSALPQIAVPIQVVSHGKVHAH